MLYGSIVLLSVAAALQTLPPIKLDTNTASNRGFSANGNNRNIYLESAVASQRDKEGLTLIPPSFSEFAETFKIDLESITNFPWTIKQVESPSTEDPGIFLGKFRNDSARLTYENGNPTEEGYELEIANGRVFIGGTGARGMFWGTRTLLQQIALARGSDIAPSRFTDAPAYPTRGYMLDAGRKWYAPSFLKELCTYASFFKLSEFHYHTSDNYPLNRDRKSVV